MFERDNKLSLIRSYTKIFSNNPVAKKNIILTKEILMQNKLHTNPKVLIIGGKIGAGLKILVYRHIDIDLFSFDIYFSDHIQFVADAHDIPFESDFLIA